MPVGELRVAAGGREFRANSIKLHSETHVRAWQEKLAAAQEQLGGFSTGVGVFASPALAVASAAAIGIFEAAVSSSKEKKGLRSLAEASRLLTELRAGGEFVSVNQVEGVRSPVPTDWCVMGTARVVTDLSAYGMFERGKMVEEKKITFAENMKGSYERDGPVKSQIVLPDEFVWFRTSDGDVAVRWSLVESYSAIER